MPGIAVLDAGGQYAHLIARRVREIGVYAEVLPLTASNEELDSFDGVIISGGPRSVYEEDISRVYDRSFSTGAPILGICYGLQLLITLFGGRVEAGGTKEYGLATLKTVEDSLLLKDLPKEQEVWMSHGDIVTSIPDYFEILASTEDCEYAVVGSEEFDIYGVQFHPEVTHTEYGKQILENFVLGICEIERTYMPCLMVDRMTKNIRETVGDRKVYFLVSGGVDSTVAYALCAKALRPGQLQGIFIDTGLLREGDWESLNDVLQHFGVCDFITVGAQRFFLSILEGLIDPEEKRRRIGEKFISVQDGTIRALDPEETNWMLGQGTIYPDTIESGGTQGSSVIKTHHNRVEAVMELEVEGRLLEPLRGFYKDEVRAVGRVLGLPDRFLNRHPFPGPGLAIRMLCSSGGESVTVDSRLSDICAVYGLRGYVLPIRSVGVQGDSRSYSSVAVLSGPADVPMLREISTEITNTCKAVNRVVYCLTPGVEAHQLDIHPGFVTEERLDILRKADTIVQKVLEIHDLLGAVWQFPVVLLPVAPYWGTQETIVLRPVCSIDGMTAEWAWELPYPVLMEMREKIEQLPGVCCVLLDVTNKPPATIEWE